MKIKEADRVKLAESCYILYRGGETLTKIGKRIGLSYSTVRNYLYKYYKIKPNKRDKEIRPSLCTRCHQLPTERDKGELTKIRTGTEYRYYYDAGGNRKLEIVKKGKLEWLCSRPGCMLPTVEEDRYVSLEYVMRRKDTTVSYGDSYRVRGVKSTQRPTVIHKH